jgi:transposase-like protein
MAHNGQQLPPFGEPERPTPPAKEPKKRPSLKHSRKKLPRPDADIVAALPAACASEEAAVEFIEQMRWGGTPACPRCASAEVRKLVGADGKRNARFLWRCYSCKKTNPKQQQFTVRIGTVYEESRLPLTVWTTAMWRCAASKKGVSALELARIAHCTHKSALFVLHRLRLAMATDWSPEPKMTGNIVVDETPVGPKPSQEFMQSQRDRGSQARGADWSKKKFVVAMRNQQTGEVRTTVVPRVTAATLRAALTFVDPKESRLITDKEPAYKGVGKEFRDGHWTTHHAMKEYVKIEGWRTNSTNPCENFLSTFKRGLNGIYHSVSGKHLHRYASHFEWLNNTRRVPDGERFRALVDGGEATDVRGAGGLTRCG